jgi:hypothetical protein
MLRNIIVTDDHGYVQYVVITDDHGYVQYVGVTDDHGYIQYVGVTIPSFFLRSWFNTEYDLWPDFYHE